MFAAWSQAKFQVVGSFFFSIWQKYFEKTSAKTPH
jgi:hypothetical protein